MPHRLPARETDLPTLPPVVAQLVSLFSSPDYTLDQVVTAVEHDPSISARVLRLANSAYYGFSRRIDTLPRAVVLLGAATVQGLALATSILRAWAAGGQPAELEGLWVHSYLVAVGCRHVGRVRPPAGMGADALFLCGLLHDVGKIRFLAEDGEGYAELLAGTPPGEDLRRREAERYGHDHAQAGGELLDAWRLPAAVVGLVAHHHEGRLRAELAPALDVLRAVNTLVQPEPGEPTGLAPELLADLDDRLEAARPEAEAFYRAIS